MLKLWAVIVNDRKGFRIRIRILLWLRISIGPAP